MVPNPWIGYEFVERVFGRLFAKWKGKENVVSNNLVFILEQLRGRLETERNSISGRVAETPQRITRVSHFTSRKNNLGALVTSVA